ncbi:MAG: hypothetical protein BA869_07500 [Desulfuromonadales bacterium C00003107]|jgi:uncharacterized protein YlxP (DUF503 family)|nr:MAG: hypothetical protein BA869_07500 [Desulfuromonadales bacterium C00003107]
MVVGVLRLELVVLGATSLKEKRSVVKKILGRCRSRFPVSCAETGLQDFQQSAQLGFAVVVSSESLAHGLFEHIENEIEQIGLADIVDRFVEFLHYS